jgi:site-specific recombinase XerD
VFAEEKEVPAYIKDNEIASEKRLFPITRQRAFQIIREAGEQAGIQKVGDKKIHNHHLRHSHCVAYIRKNNTLEGLRKLQQRIGHANIQTTAHYLQFGPEQQKETEEIFGKW